MGVSKQPRIFIKVDLPDDEPFQLEALTPGGVWRGKGLGFDNYYYPGLSTLLTIYVGGLEAAARLWRLFYSKTSSIS